MKKGMIYKIELQDEIYIGSTEEKLCIRQSKHQYDLKHYPNRKLYKKCIEQGITEIKLIWVADIEFNHTAQKRMIEEEYRKELNAGLNMIRCYTTDEEKKENAKEYREKHKENFKEYRENHKEYFKKYRENHKEQILEYKKDYYEKNKDIINAKQKEKIECPICKSIVYRTNLARHQKTKKCMNHK